MQQRFRSEEPYVFAEEVNEIALSGDNDNTIQSTDTIEIYGYETSKDLAFKKNIIKCNNIIK